MKEPLAIAESGPLWSLGFRGLAGLGFRIRVPVKDLQGYYGV